MGSTWSGLPQLKSATLGTVVDVVVAAAVAARWQGGCGGEAGGERCGNGGTALLSIIEAHVVVIWSTLIQGC